MNIIKQIYRKLVSAIKRCDLLYRTVVKVRSTSFTWLRPRANHRLYEQLSNLSDNLPDYEGCSYYSKCDINIAIITDQFMYNYYNDALNLIYITLDNYVHFINEKTIDYVMFVSCWEGLGGSNDWKGRENRGKVIEVFNYAQKYGIKSIFQTIEDPSNYNEYLSIAKQADYIFTSCSEKIKEYIYDTNNENVFLLEYYKIVICNK